MANFTRKDYEAQKEASGMSNAGQNRTPIAFLGTLLNKEGASAVVRFPYHSIDDIIYTTTHTVMDYPGSIYGKKIQCEDHDCPLCDAGVKKNVRVLLKMVAYVQEGNSIVPQVVLWDRPAAYADIDLKDAFDNYGDLTNRLFKIKRSGEKMNTRYTLLPIDRDNAIYNNTTCPIDFTELDTIDATKIMTKTYTQYQAALHPEMKVTEAPKAEESVKPVEYIEPEPVAQPTPQPAPEPTPQSAATQSETRSKRYLF